MTPLIFLTSRAFKPGPFDLDLRRYPFAVVTVRGAILTQHTSIWAAKAQARAFAPRLEAHVATCWEIRDGAYTGKRLDRYVMLSSTEDWSSMDASPGQIVTEGDHHD